MAALCAWLLTILAVPLFLVLDTLTGGYLVDELYTPVPFISVSWVVATMVYLVIVYIGSWVLARWVLRISRELDSAGQPPAWAEKLAAVQRFVSWDDGEWPSILTLLSVLVCIAGLPALIFELVSPVTWTLLALAVPTLLALQRGRIPPSPLPEGERTIDRTVAEGTPPQPQVLLAALCAAPNYRGELRAVLSQPQQARAMTPADGPRPAWAGAFRPGGLLATAISAAGLSGVDALYPHQQHSLELLLSERRAGEPTRNIVLATGPGSGKHLTIFLAALDRTLHRGGNVLFVAPDDAALEREYRRFRELAERADWHYALHEARITLADVGVYPDPPPEILFCTLETLHAVLLRENHGWREFFDGLDLLVAFDIDHYTGIVGANAAQVFRRLSLVIQEHGPQPQLLATARPAAGLGPFAARLFGRTPPSQQIEVSTLDSSPRPSQTFALWSAAQWDGTVTRHIPADAGDTAALHLCLSLLAQPSLRLLVVSGPGREQRVARLMAALHARGGAADGRLRYVPDHADLGTYLTHSDVLLLFGSPARVSDLTWLAGPLGRERSGGLVLVLDDRSPAMLHLERELLNPIAAPTESERLLPLRADHPLVIAKHLRCAALETRLTRERSAAVFGRCASAITTHWVEQGEAALEEVLIDHDGEPRWERVLRVDPVRAPVLYGNCRLDTIAAADLLPINGPNAEPVRWIDATRAALTLVEGRVVVPGPQPLVLAEWDGEETPAAVVGDAGTPRVAPLYAVSRPPGAAPEDDPSAFSIGPDARRLRRLGSDQRIEIYRLTTEIEQRLAGLRTMAGRHAPFVRPADMPRSASYHADGLVLAVIAEDAATEERIAHTLQHALGLALRADLSPGILESEVQVLGIPNLATPEHRGAGILLTDGVDGGAGLAGVLVSALDHLLEASYRILLACPCRNGCAACISDPACSASSWAPDCATQLDKRATLRFLGEALGPAAAALAGMSPAALDHLRYEIVADEQILAGIRERVLRTALAPLLNLDLDADLPPPARFMDADEQAATDLAGRYLIDDPWREIVLRPATERDLVATLAHLYAHDLLLRPGPDGALLIHPSLNDPDSIPLEGRLFREGIAQWLELRALDALDFPPEAPAPTFRIFNDYPEGERIIATLAARHGIAGLLAWLRDPPDPLDLPRLAALAGVDGALRAHTRRLHTTDIALPEDDIG